MPDPAASPPSPSRIGALLPLAALLAALAAFPFVADAIGQPALTSLGSRILCYGIAAASLNLALGYGGMVSFGHAAFFGLGAYVAGVMAQAARAGELAFGFLPASDQLLPVLLTAVLLGAVAATLIGALSLRTSGVQFIMITLAFAQLVYFVLMSLQIYGGDDGLMMQQRNTLPGLNLDAPNTFYYLCLAALAVWTFVCARIVNSRFGMVLQALRQSERRAVNLGAAPTPYRLSAFVLSAIGTGLAGVLWANYAGLVTPDMAAWTKSGELMAMVILGGAGTLLGPIAGAAVFLGLEQALTAWTEHWMLVMGPVLVLVVLAGRNGLFGRWLGGHHGG